MCTISRVSVSLYSLCMSATIHMVLNVCERVQWCMKACPAVCEFVCVITFACHYGKVYVRSCAHNRCVPRSCDPEKHFRLCLVFSPFHLRSSPYRCLIPSAGMTQSPASTISRNRDIRTMHVNEISDKGSKDVHISGASQQSNHNTCFNPR